MSFPARPLAAVAVVAVAAAGLGAYFGFKGITAARGGSGSAPGATPSPRVGAGLAEDAAHGNTVLFGGLDAAANPPKTLGDTWTWDGSAWTQQHPSVSPPPAAFNLMAFDPAGHDVLLVTTPGGGVSSSANLTPQPHTWVWDGMNWHESSASPPEVSGLSRMATDAATNSVILVTPARPVPGPLVPCRTGPEPAEPLPSGCPPLVTAGRVSTWRWDGAAWHDMGTTSAADFGALGASFSGLVTDPATGHAELFDTRQAIGIACGGVAPAPTGSGAPAAAPCLGAPQGPALPAFVPAMTVRRWTGAAWSSPQTVSPPDSGRSQGTVVADPAGHRVLWVSGFDGSTWAFDGTAWGRLTAALQPAISQGSAATGADGHPLVFGGMAAATGGRLAVSSQTWTWNGSAWQSHGGSLATLAPVQATGLPGVVPPAGIGGSATPAGTVTPATAGAPAP